MDTTEKEIPEEALKEKIIRQVLDGTGEIKDFKDVRASNVFDNRWRVDVWCYYDSTQTIVATKCSKIYYSYFIHTDDDGKITKSNPEIVKEH